MKFDTKKISASLDTGYMDATALAEYLVSKGVAFRQAHGIVGQLVAKCEQKNKTLGKLSLKELQSACDVIDKDVYDCLGAVKVAGKYVTQGSAGKSQSKQQVELWKKELAGR